MFSSDKELWVGDVFHDRGLYLVLEQLCIL